MSAGNIDVLRVEIADADIIVAVWPETTTTADGKVKRHATVLFGHTHLMDHTLNSPRDAKLPVLEIGVDNEAEVDFLFRLVKEIKGWSE